MNNDDKSESRKIEKNRKNGITFDTLAIEEYKALREESLRSAQFISNTVWIGLSGYLLGITSFLFTINIDEKLRTSIYSITLIVLIIESIAASSMYLSEVFKYVRVGSYIRDKKEKLYNKHIKMKVYAMNWESYIKNKRSNLFYIISLSILQLPVIFTILILINSLTKYFFLTKNIYQIIFYCNGLNIVIGILIICDVCIVVAMVIRIKQIEK